MIKLERANLNGRLDGIVTGDDRTTTVGLDTVVDAFGDDCEHFVRPLVHHYNSREIASQRSFLVSLRRFGTVAAKWRMLRLPVGGAEWQFFLNTLFTDWFAQTQLSLRTRISTWAGVLHWLKLLRDGEDLIPLDVEFPVMQKDWNDWDDEYSAPLLGDAPLETASDSYQKVIMNISLARSDAEYLDEVRNTLSSRRRLLDDACQAWWEQIEAHFRYGQRLLMSVDWDILQPHLKEPHYFRDWENRGSSNASGRTEKSLANLLALLHHGMAGLFTATSFNETPYLPSLSTLALPDSAPPIVSPGISVVERLHWMLGNLNNQDCCFAQVALTIHHPVLSGASFCDAKLTNRQGDLFLTLGEHEQSVRVVKMRAHAIKESRLDACTTKLFTCILDMTKAHRDRLVGKKSPLANYLLLVADGTKVLRARLSMSKLLRPPQEHHRQCWMGTYFPDAGTLCRDTAVTLRKIRATEGVLEWLRTGSIAAATARLGNSKHVLIEHYIPRALSVVWYARQVRRYQNLHLAAATPDDISLTDVLDFASLDEIHAFIRGAFGAEIFATSPLGKILREKSTDKDRSKNRPLFRDLVLPVSTGTLSVLYLYQECALEVGFSNQRVRQTLRQEDIQPDDIIALAELARFRMPTDRDPRMREAHDAALLRLETLRKQYRWQDLMLQAVGQ
jgi:hypothetical protein